MFSSCAKKWLLITGIVLSGRLAVAQESNGLWHNVKSTPQQASKSVQKAGSRFKKFKEHLQQWWLDENYNYGLALGTHINSNGWTGLLYYQRRIDKTKCYFIQLGVSEIKHEKEVKQQRTNTAFPELGAGLPFN